MPPARFSLSNLSIKHRLPLLIGILLLGMVMASTWASYRGVKESALEIGRERLQNVTQQLAQLSQQSTAHLLTKTATAANDSLIRAYLESPSPSTRSGASATLRQFNAEQDANSLQVELWDINHSLVLTEPGGMSPAAVDLRKEFEQSARDPFKAVGALRLVKDLVVSPAVAAVKDSAGKPIGWLVRWRQVAVSPDPRGLKDLLGSEAALYFGNIKGDVWTDLVKAVPKPPTDLASTLKVTHYVRDGKSVMALGRPITGTPFFLVVEFSNDVILSHSNHFLRSVLIADTVLLAIGIVGAFAISRSITQPLRTLTKAASAISGGDRSRLVDIRQHDELGALGSAFNVMVTKVGDSQRKLEGTVQDLRQSEQRLQTVIENLNDGLVISDLNRQLLYWNKAALEMHGFDNLEECLLKLPEFTRMFEISDLDHNVLDVERWPLPRVINGEQLDNLELRIRRLDVDWNRIFSYGGNIVREANGRLVAFLTTTDITERKQAEEERRLLALLVESSEDAIIAKTLDGTITSWNKAAEKLYGYSAKEVLGRPVGILFPPEVVDDVETILKRLRRGDSIDHFETARIAKDGTRLWVSLTISPIKDELGAISGFSTITRDITEPKRGAEALRNSEIRYRRLFESAKDGILILDADSGRIIDVNPYLIEMLGMPKEEIVGQQLWQLGPFKDILASKLAFAELQRRGHVRYENLPLEDSEGQVRQVEFVSNSYLVGESRVLQCNIRDITERKLAEEDLRQTNQRLEGALAELQIKTHELATMTQQLWQASKLTTMGELAASIAHELNNPLATISLRAEMLVGQLATEDPNRHSVLVIEEEVERMATLISNLLLFSRRSHRQLSTVNLCDELTSSLDFIQYHLRSHKIDIVTDCATDLPTVQADRQQLRQVFLNLITNAGDAMPEGGTLTVRSHAGAMPGGQPGVVIEFSDTGTGIKTDDLPKLWEPFFTTKPEGKGTGLGLPICRRTVEEHRGIIEIETRPLRGTTVRVTLPATDEGIEVAA